MFIGKREVYKKKENEHSANQSKEMIEKKIRRKLKEEEKKKEKKRQRTKTKKKQGRKTKDRKKEKKQIQNARKDKKKGQIERKASGRLAKPCRKTTAPVASLITARGHPCKEAPQPLDGLTTLFTQFGQIINIMSSCRLPVSRISA